jgi:dethiobiotin synthetase
VRGLFITGTDTGAGKTILSAALVAAMVAAGERVRAYKPVVTGLEEPAGEWPADHELLASVAGMTPEEVAPLRYGPAVSPHLAAELAGERIEPERLIQAARASAALATSPANAATATSPATATCATSATTTTSATTGALVVEGVGGLLVPLAEDFTVRDLAVELALPLLIAARPGLGTINHTLLTLDAARAVGLDVRAVVLTPWPDRPSAMERSNRETIARKGEIEVSGLTPIAHPAQNELAQAGAELPWRLWLTLQSCIPGRT